MMNPNNSLSSKLIPSRLTVVGTKAFGQLGLTPEEIRLFLTLKDRADWPERLQRVIPDFVDVEIDEEEL
jgi:hypothetical protein